MDAFLKATAVAGSAELVLVMLLMVLPRLGPGGRALSGGCARAPLLDLVVALLTWIPWIAAGALAGWPGFAGAVAGQVVVMVLWTAGHEMAHRDAVRGPRLVKVHHKLVGRWRNLAALWFSVLAFPFFWMVRLGQVLLYPPIRRLLGFPVYRHGDWVNVSRQKFGGLVGHDLIWCLYCDWMTGIYALGGEMLRNVESFWCPIRFYDGKKCDNCRVDFPDIDGGWVPADGTMADAERVLLDQYGDGRREWFGHPARLTIEGDELDSRTAS